MTGNSTVNLIALDPNSILQSDVTIIAGLLVLLTISGVLKEKIGMHTTVWKFLRWLIGSTSTLFSISTIVILIGNVETFTQDAILTFSRWVFVCGLTVLVISIIVLMASLKSNNQ